MKRGILVAAVLAATGCQSLTGCEEDRQVIEADFASPFYEIQLRSVESWRSRGYRCDGSESIRNAFGRVIGTRYVCTKCG